MAPQLRLSIGQHSHRGAMEINQDFHGALVPAEPLLSRKGIAVALADGIGSSSVSHIASETAVANFLADYYCTSDAWSVKKSAQKVLFAANSWLHSQTRQSPFRYEKDKGYVCTFSALVFKSTTAHLFHVGDCRIHRLQGNTLEQLTQDHRLWISEHKSYLSRALGIEDRVDVDYQALPLQRGDVFVLTSDGVHETLAATAIAQLIHAHSDDLEQAAQQIVAAALAQGCRDNLTIQIVRVDDLPHPAAGEVSQQVTELPLPPPLEANRSFDGYRIRRELHISHRSHAWLAWDPDAQTQVVLKIPAMDCREDSTRLERLLMEEWVARRLNSPHLLKAAPPSRDKHFLYVAFEYVPGQTLAQWMRDNPNPPLETVRDLIEQIARGLRAFHRQDMLHQDLRPENIMIDEAGVVRIIDYGSARIEGIQEMQLDGQAPLLGTAQFTAPEYFLGQPAGANADLYSLGVIAYQLLSGKLPYGLDIVKCRTREQQHRLKYRSLLQDNPAVPLWVDEAIRKAVQPDPRRRYQALSEFVFDLRHPNPVFLKRTRPPLLERNPVRFWQGVSFLLLWVILYLLAFPLPH